jgi:Cd2+-exporting ATPase
MSSTASPSGTCAASCCTSGESGKVEKPSIVVAKDPENQAAGSEHVVLCVSGMTCTGCETKLNRTLATVPGVRNLKTSLVLSRAEFDVELSLVTADDVMKHLERTTEFKCDKISSGSSIEILAPGDVSAFIDETWPAGVIDMSPASKETIRITFDPKVIGARDLVDKHLGSSVRLAPVRADPGLEAGRKHVLHVGYMTLLSAALTIPVLVLAWAPLPERGIPYGSASLALATIVQVFIAGPFYPKALKALIFSRVIEMDLLIVLSTSAAYIFSVVSFGYLVAGKPLSTGQFFETSTLLVTLIMVGRYVAALARQKAVESVSIRSLQVSNALIVDGADASNEREIDARLLQYGDIFKVLPDSRIPTDGTVVAGSSEVDESMLTGESLSVEKQAQSRVIAGTVNGSGSLVVRLARLPGDNTVTTIAAMVDEAKLSKPRLQDLADRVASYFVPVIITLTIIVFVVWVAVGMAVRGKSGSAATVDAITYAITVLIVSCPCAIGLAVPMVVVITSGVAAESGVIFKSASAIEVAHKTSHVVFDKTGTLTQGKLTVVSEYCVDINHSTLELLLGLINDNRHPVSLAVIDHLRSKGVAAAVVSGAKSLTGKGLEAQVAGRALRAGNSRWLQLSSDVTVQSVLAQNYTAFCFTIDGVLAAVFGLEDSLRADAARVVSNLQKRGISVHVVSGDDDGPVKDVAAKLNIPNNNIHARSSPADKQAYINDLLDHTPEAKKPIVIFCGDGTNDAVALAQATIGVHMNEGSDVAQSAADVVLMRPELAGILTILNTSKRSFNRIKFNFAWSFVYNTFAVLLAAGAFVRVRIPPEFAGLGELVSVLPVIAAAVLLRWSRN